MVRAADVDAELRLARQHRLGDVRGGVVEDAHAVLGMARRIALDDARKVLHAHGGHARDGDVAAHRLAGLAHLDERRGEVGHEAPRARQEPAAERRERRGARGALDQAHAE